MPKKYHLKHNNHLIRLRFPVQKIETICQYGAPSVVSHDCSGLEKDFSRSPYWLFCPHLIHRIHQIESNGWIKILQDFVQGPISKQWREFTELVPSILQKNLSREYFEHLKAEGRTHIGGVKDPFNLKCLHAHYSFYKVHGMGWVGSFVEGLLMWRAKREYKQTLLECTAQNLECDYHGEMHD